MEPIAIKLAKYIVLKNPKSKEKYDIYKYGLQVFLETGVSFLFSFFIGIWFGMVKQFLFFIIIFRMFRSYAGGFHMETFGSCFGLSMAIVTLVLAATKYVRFPSYIISILCAVMILFILYLGPIENRHAPFSDKKRKILKKKLCTLIIVVIAFMPILLILRLKEYLSLLTYTLFVVVIGMIIGNLNRFSIR